jgi:hypothetical protein
MFPNKKPLRGRPVNFINTAMITSGKLPYDWVKPR